AASALFTLDAARGEALSRRLARGERRRRRCRAALAILALLMLLAAVGAVELLLSRGQRRQSALLSYCCLEDRGCLELCFDNRGSLSNFYCNFTVVLELLALLMLLVAIGAVELLLSRGQRCLELCFDNKGSLSKFYCNFTVVLELLALLMLLAAVGAVELLLSRGQRRQSALLSYCCLEDRGCLELCFDNRGSLSNFYCNFTVVLELIALLMLLAAVGAVELLLSRGQRRQSVLLSFCCLEDRVCLELCFDNRGSLSNFYCNCTVVLELLALLMLLAAVGAVELLLSRGQRDVGGIQEKLLKITAEETFTFSRKL
ncbi:hypothetical protein MSG28_008871, partial [Choristoneura fumiferana]